MSGIRIIRIYWIQISWINNIYLFYFFLRYENIVNIVKRESQEVTLSDHWTNLDVLVNQVPKGDSVTGTYTL